jgi:hypothetical protein
MKLLDVSEPTFLELINVEKAITHGSGMRAREKLREVGVTEFVIRSVEMRLMPPPNDHVAA